MKKEKPGNSPVHKISFLNRCLALILCLCVMVAGFSIIDVRAAEYADIRDWVPVTERPVYDQWGGQGASSVPNIEKWKDVGYDKTIEGSYFVWGKQITWNSEADAWALFSQNDDLNAVVDYLNDTYKYIAGYHQNQIWICIPVSWSLGSSEMVNGNVRHTFEATSVDSFKTGSAQDMGYTGSENVYNGSHTIKLYLYIESTPEGLEGVTDWMPKDSAADNPAWIESGAEGKDITLRDEAALENATLQAGFAAWLNNAENGYTQMIVKTDDWTEPFDVTWIYDADQSKLLNTSVPDGYRYFAFSASTGTNVFYGAEGVYQKDIYTPLKFYLYFMVEAEREPEEIRGVNGWRLVLKGTSDAVVTAYDDNSIYLLPNIIEGTGADDYRKYVETLLEMYDFQVSFDGNATYNTVDLEAFSYQANGNFLIEPFDHFYWSWGNALNPRVKVRYDGEGRTSPYCNNWNLVGNSGENATVGREGYTVSANWLEIRGWDYKELIDGKEEEFAETLMESYLFLKAESGGKWQASKIVNIEYDPVHSAEINKSKIHKTAFYKVTIYDDFRTANGQTAEFYIFFTGEEYLVDLDEITVKPKDPDGIRMNLFDYWINDSDPSSELGSPWDNFENWEPNYYWEDFDGGVNKDHALKFFNMAFANNERPWMSNQLGWWNYGTQGDEENKTGIVKSTLTRRYPQLNLGDSEFIPADTNNPYLHSGTSKEAMTESLAYLFDPTMEQNGKLSYANVTGLFQRNSEGYYYYDSKLNFAQYDELYNTFLLYNTWGVAPNSAASANGQFFPFNNVDDVYKGVSTDQGQTTLDQYTAADGITSRSERFNHYFGFSMEIDFQQPEGGKINASLGATSEDMVFKFAGDDDVWIFVDGVLALDLGGVHNGVYGEINFATGEVITGLSDPNKPGTAMTGQPWIDTTLRELFEAAGVPKPGIENDGEWEGNTFAYDTLHTIKIFYLERGHYDSNLAMYFNLQSRVPHKIYKVDEDGNPLAGATFAIYAAEPSPSSFKANETYHTADEFVPVNRDGSAATWDTVEPLNAELVTDTDGYVTLGGIDFFNRAEKAEKAETPEKGIYYFLEETSPAPGYRVLPERLVLEFQPDKDSPLKSVFRVLNRYETGAYASFSAILEDRGENMYYATTTVDPDSGKMDITPSRDDKGDWQIIDPDHQASAMLFAVPMVYTNIGDGEKWYPVYGRNTFGFHVVDIYSESDYYGHSDNTNGYTDNTVDGQQAAARWALRHNLLAAALRQTADIAAPDWYFHYDTITDSSGKIIDSRFSAELLNGPGDKYRYLVNADGDNVGVNDADLRLMGLLVDAESIVTLINGFGGSITIEEFLKLSDQDKYILLQNTLLERGFDTEWDGSYYDGDPWDTVRNLLDIAYDTNTETTTRDRGVNLAYIDEFTRYYGSVIYIPNERREFRVLKQDPDGNPLPGAVFEMYETFADAAERENPLSRGTTGENGLLIFSRTRDTSPANEGSGWAWMDWDGYNDIDSDQDDIVWLREVSAPEGFAVNESIVQIYVGQRTIFANASAYRADDNGKPELIDDLTGVADPRNFQGTDGVTVWAGIGKLFQSMEKFADPVLNSTLLDIDGATYFYLPEEWNANPEEAEGKWMDQNELSHLHFWDRLVLGYTSSDYSKNHKDSESSDDDIFAFAENGYLKVLPTQTPEDIFKFQHDGEIGVLGSRRENLFYKSDGDPLNLYNIFAPVSGVVIRDEYEGNLRITKVVKGSAPEAENKRYTFKITTELNDVVGKEYPVEGAVEESITFTLIDGLYIAKVTVEGAGTVTVKDLPLGEYTVEEILDDVQIDGYEHEVSYSPEDGKVTVEEDKAVTVTVTNRYFNDSECRLTITDGGHYGEENCGDEKEIFLYKVTGTTSTGEEIELTVSVHGGGSTTIVLPPGEYVVEELHDWSWRYKNKKTEGKTPEEEWTVSEDWITAETTLEPGDEKEVIYYHSLEKNWLGGENSLNNHFGSDEAVMLFSGPILTARAQFSSAPTARRPAHTHA